MLDYHPEGMSMWDTWGIARDGVAHMFYLQFYGEDSTRDRADADWLGHAVSSDLLHWTERPLAIGPGPAGGLEDLQPWTGSLVEHAGTYHFYYTMRSSRDQGFGQKMGLAIGRDLENWERYPGNPVLVPDPRYYVGYDNPLPKTTIPGGVVDCRDMVVITDPKGGGWLGYFATRVPPGTAPQTAAIGLAHSEDLIHWEQLPPAFVPGTMSAIEVPDVYEIDGRWYLTCLTGNRYGNRGFFSDPNVLLGTIYAVADSAEGPFELLPDDNVLLGGLPDTGYTCRTMVYEGERLMFYTQPIHEGPATVSPPMALRAVSGGRLRLAFSDYARGWRKTALIAPGDQPPIARLPFTQFYWDLHGGMWTLEGGVYHGRGETGWQTADLGLGAEHIELSASVTLHDGAAVGFVFRPDQRVPHAGNSSRGDLVFYLDAERGQAVSARLPAFDRQHVRSFPVERGRPYLLRLCIRQPRFELYVDDVLVLQGALHPQSTPAPSVGLFVDRGRAAVADLALYELG